MPVDQQQSDSATIRRNWLSFCLVLTFAWICMTIKYLNTGEPDAGNDQAALTKSMRMISIYYLYMFADSWFPNFSNFIPFMFVQLSANIYFAMMQEKFSIFALTVIPLFLHLIRKFGKADSKKEFFIALLEKGTVFFLVILLWFKEINEASRLFEPLQIQPTIGNVIDLIKLPVELTAFSWFVVGQTFELTHLQESIQKYLKQIIIITFIAKCASLDEMNWGFVAIVGALSRFCLVAAMQNDRFPKYKSLSFIILLRLFCITRRYDLGSSILRLFPFAE